MQLPQSTSFYCNNYDLHRINEVVLGYTLASLILILKVKTLHGNVSSPNDGIALHPPRAAAIVAGLRSVFGDKPLGSLSDFVCRL